MLDWLKKLLGNSNDAEVKKLDKIVDQVEALEDSYKQLTDEQLVAAGVNPGLIRFSTGCEHIDDILADIEQALATL